MPVTLIGSKWSSGSLIFFTKSTGAAVITIAPALVTITPATTVTGILTSNGGITMGDAKNIITNATTGTKIGTATSQKIGFWNVTPVIQPTAYTQTYATANKTLIADGTTDVATADLVDDGGAYSAAWCDTVVTMGNELKADYNLLRAQVLDAMQFVNSVVDDFQLMGLLS